MKKLIVILLVLLPGWGIAQSVSFSPYSTKIWGQIDGTAKLSVAYKDIKIVGLYATKNLYRVIDNEVLGTYSGYFWGVFYTPLEMEWNAFRIEGGGGLWNRRFPTPEGEHLHFTLQLSYQVNDRLSVGYTHYSNGFGLWNRFNPGLDNIGLTIHFN